MISNPTFNWITQKKKIRAKLKVNISQYLDIFTASRGIKTVTLHIHYVT